MSITGSVFELPPPIAGAKSDLVFLHSDTPYVVTTADQSLFVGGSKMVSGAYKLMQQVVLGLFTAIDQVPFASGRGTDMGAEILRVGINNEAAMRTVFAISREQLLNEFRTRQDKQPDLPAEEVLVDLVLLNLQILGDSVYMQLQLKTGAAQLLNIQLPVTYHV